MPSPQNFPRAPETDDFGQPGEVKNELRGALSALRRRAGLILICAFAAGAIAVGLSLLQEKQYTASATLLFRDPGFAQGVFGNASIPSSSSDPTREAATNLQLVGLQVVADRTAEAQGGESSGDDLLDRIDVEAEGNSDLVSVNATDPDPAGAQALANDFAEQFISFRADADRSKLLAAKSLADRQFNALSPSDQVGPRGEQLSRGAERLGILASLQTGNAELVQVAELPDSPSSPKIARNGAIGLLLGLLAGIGLAIVLERFNRRIREPEEAATAFGVPLLGSIPQSKSIVDSNRGVISNLPFREEEAFQMFGASLRYFNVDSEVRSILITSDSSGSGKSTVAWNLARVSARSLNVVLLETDLRSPSIASNHGITPGPGLSELLTHQVELDQSVQSIDLDGTDSKLDVITSGSVPPNPASLLESETMSTLFTELVSRYDLVIVDTPPTGVVADSFPLMPHVDGVIVVTRMNHTSEERAQALRDQLAQLGAPLIGVVANGVRLRRDQKYGYGYYGSSQPDAATTDVR